MKITLLCVHFAAVTLQDIESIFIFFIRRCCHEYRLLSKSRRCKRNTLSRLSKLEPKSN